MQILDQSEILQIASDLIQLINSNGATIIQDELQTSPLQNQFVLILNACYAFNIFLTNEIMPNTRGSKSNNNETIIKLGTALIFQLRQLITGDSLKFVLAGSTREGLLKESVHSQDEIFSLKGMKNFRVSFSNAQIELAACIESLKHLNDADTNLAAQWKKILQYGFVKNPRDQEIIDVDDGGEMYHKADKDINVYMKYITTKKRKSLTYYYMLNGENPRTRDELNMGKAYDRGWMYQWLKMNTDIEIDDTSLTPLLPLMTSEGSFRENIAGIRSGDQGSEQYKFRNRRVITLNNIQEILTGSNRYNGIIPSLQYLIQNWSTPHAALGQLMQDFTTLNNQEITAFVEKRVVELDLNIK